MDAGGSQPRASRARPRRWDAVGARDVGTRRVAIFARDRQVPADYGGRPAPVASRPPAPATTGTPQPGDRSNPGTPAAARTSPNRLRRANRSEPSRACSEGGRDRRPPAHPAGFRGCERAAGRRRERSAKPSDHAIPRIRVATRRARRLGWGTVSGPSRIFAGAVGSPAQSSIGGRPRGPAIGPGLECFCVGSSPTRLLHHHELPGCTPAVGFERVEVEAGARRVRGVERHVVPTTGHHAIHQSRDDSSVDIEHP